MRKPRCPHHPRVLWSNVALAGTGLYCLGLGSWQWAMIFCVLAGVLHLLWDSANRGHVPACGRTQG